MLEEPAVLYYLSGHFVSGGSAVASRKRKLSLHYGISAINSRKTQRRRMILFHKADIENNLQSFERKRLQPFIAGFEKAFY